MILPQPVTGRFFFFPDSSTVSDSYVFFTRCINLQPRARHSHARQRLPLLDTDAPSETTLGRSILFTLLHRRCGSVQERTPREEVEDEEENDD